jgi:sporulation protein YlmC with PRC-barrel domain
MKQSIRTVFLSDLMGCSIVTAQGKTLGHIRDVEISEGPEYCVKALLYGWGGVAQHLHMLNPFRSSQQEPPRPQAIPWHAVESFEARVVRLRAGFNEKS